MLLALSILLAVHRGPECALGAPDGGCLATPCEFVWGRDGGCP